MPCADRLKSSLSVDELAEASEVIVAGKCTAAETVYQLGQIYTLSEIRNDSVYKGGIRPGDVLQVVETGGRDSCGEYERNCPADAKDSLREPYPEDSRIAIRTDGFFPMKAGDSVLLLLGDTTGFLQEADGTVYGITGDYDGRLYLQIDSTYRKPSPSLTDEPVLEEGNLMVDPETLKELMK